MSDRDTHFLGFAKLLFREIKEEWDEDLSFDATLHKIIAQRAYDLACHLASNVSTGHIGLMRAGLENVEQCVDAIPDMTELPRGEE